MDIFQDDQRLVFGNDLFKVVVFGIADMKIMFVLHGHKNSVRSVAVVRATGDVVSGSSDKTVIVWNMERMGVRNVLRGHSGFVSCIGVVGGDVISAGSDRSLKIWRGRDEYLSSDEMHGHIGRVEAIAADPDWKTVSTYATDKKLCVWDVRQRTEIGRFKMDELVSIAVIIGKDLKKKRCYVVTGDCYGMISVRKIYSED